MSEQSFEPEALDELRERIEIRDRAVLKNAWACGHGDAGWEAIEIGF